jgi:putative ABC transport system permease protein
VQTAGVMQSSEDAVLTWLDRTIAADLFVTANSPVTSSGSSQPMSDSLRKELARLPEVRAVVPVRFHLTDHAGKKVYLVAVDPAHFIDTERLPNLLPGMELVPRLRESGTAIVSENFAALYGVKPGDTLRFPGKNGSIPLQVLGTMQDYTWTRGTVFVDRAQYLRDFGDADIDVFNVYLKDEVLAQNPDKARDEVRKVMLQRWGAEEALVVLTREETKNGVRGQVRKLYAFGYAQELVVGIVAALGVLMALLISVLQRRRELGLFRAVGASQGQVLRTVLAEATLMGVAMGLPLEWYMVRILLLQEAGFVLPLSIPWTSAALVIVCALLLATAAGLWPAWHAMRLRIADAIAYE